MISLEEMERRILSELQEAGEENIAALLNTVIEPADDMGQAYQLQQALRRLVQAEFAQMALARDRIAGLKPLTSDESLALIENIPSTLEFQGNKRRWAWASGSTPQVVVTDAGQAQADKILEEQGYQWWRQS